MHAYLDADGLPADHDQNAVEDNSNDEDLAQKKRNRRASEGSYLIKGDSKKSGDLRCDTCGKGYKHSSCLTKHMYVYQSRRRQLNRVLICTQVGA